MMLSNEVLNGFNISSVTFINSSPYFDRHRQLLPKANYFFTAFKEKLEFYVRLEDNTLEIFFWHNHDIDLPSFIRAKISDIKIALKDAYIAFFESDPAYRLLYATGLLDIRIQ